MADVACVSTETLQAYRRLRFLPSRRPGKVLATRADGRVLSIQPGGAHEWRDADTDGPFEQATKGPRALVYAYRGWPDGAEHIYVVPLIDDVEFAN